MSSINLNDFGYNFAISLVTGKISQVSCLKIGADRSEKIDQDAGDTEANR